MVIKNEIGEYVLTCGNEACANTGERIVKVRAITPDELKEVILP